jgi:hypothetical protein
MNASAISSEEDRVRQILANRMAELQATPGFPDAKKETKIATGYGDVVLIQRCVPAGLKVEQNIELTGINLVTLRAEWRSGGGVQSKQIQFYVYRGG